MNRNLSTEFGQDSNFNTVAPKVQQSAQNKVQDNFQTPNEKYDEEFAVDTASNISQSVQSSARGKVQENFKTPNEKFDENFNAKQ
ncbi:hypothetical protein Q5741_13225 [Paenibacillus sp. JX-17]|uniref:Small, acid-soluble spore protein gamma-type n=2 Tax=Paenibacillus lacisoli TaxID=3064525 RepID=A0ABT9CDL5_9BACL|nr:hypothetical protein [Paenibacillus sp. JX-17]MDO7907368.1 hypothetical protein [Paenibacillus sp. JX-17]